MNKILRALLVALALGGLLASVLVVLDLKQAVVGCQNLYRVDLAGSQIESDLEYETQESRRAFLYALAVPDPNLQLPYIDEARVATQRVQETLRRLRLLRSPKIAGSLDAFQVSWEKYSVARDQIVALILEGDTPGAIGAERELGQPAFQAALRSLHLLKSVLADQANRESAQVNQTLKRCGAALAALAICTLLIVGLLSKASRDRRMALESLHASNAALAEAREMEQQRASILELVSTHAPLARTLGRVAELAPRSSAPAGAAVWAATDCHLRFQVAANLPQELTKALEKQELLSSDEISNHLPQLEGHHRALAGQFELVACKCRALHDAGGRIIGMLQLFARGENDAVRPAVLDQMAQLAAVAIENTLLYERLAFQAQHDALTGLPNRLLFQDRVQQALRLARRHQKRAAVIWVDLDRYKQINDTLGHRVGDEVLCEVSRRLTGCLRESDTVARVGGDEFIVLANDIANPADAELVSRKILVALARPMMMLEEREVAITASAGIGIFPEHGEDPLVLMRNADLAMYSAKRSGGNTHYLFRPALGDSLLRRRQIEQELKTALERNEFTLEYQPLMNRQGRLAGMEALLRWTNASLGRVSPADFIPIAEEMGLIRAIGEWVTRTACQTGGSWLRSGYDVPRIAVNVSAVQSGDKDFAPVVQQALEDNQFPAAKLEMEITETALMSNLSQALQQIETLRRLGVRFAIDDFGTGYSSLSQLRDLPVDSLKIDRSFIKDLDKAGGGSNTLVRGIIALAHSLELEVVAEGVETEEQLTLLRAMGCDVNQGFFLHRPMPPSEVEKLLEYTVGVGVEDELGRATELVRA